ncbi:MAG: phosphoribosylaminoimidazolesuccinocarboxamide synthase [Euryarchaeota archaeon]|nr:phosphoribosylaminoimidazolesuccinocarboxamide synthase [Euryarchaeota archaeon]
MLQKSILYEGKTKIAYLTDDPEKILLEFKDDITAFDGKKHEIIPGKGRTNALISAKLFELLEKSNLNTHYLNFVEPNAMLVRKLDMIRLEVTCRNIATGSLVKRLPFKEKQVLNNPIIECYYKSDEYHDPLINDDHIKALKIANEFETEQMRETILKANSILQKFLLERKIILADFKLEFGRDSKGQIFIGDEISPDSCRLWDKTTLKSLDKDVFRRGELNVKEIYQEIFRRIVGA